MARSRSITGPYETHPQKHLLTARFAPDSPLQRTGPGQYVETPEGEAYHTYLVGRPLTGPRGNFCALGRETGIAACEWRADGWLYLKGGGLVPPVSVPMDAVTLPDLALSRDFSGPELPPEFQWLRTPEPGRIFALTGQTLRRVGRESLGSWFEQSLLARRQEHHADHAAAVFHADPPSWQQAIGLTTYYNRTKFHAALISREPGIGRCLRLISCLGDWPGEALTLSAPVPLPAQDIRLEVRVTGARQQFYWATVAGNAQPFGPELDASLISDEGGRGEHASFTGAFVGILAYDMTGQGWSAEVTRFDYSPLTMPEQA